MSATALPFRGATRVPRLTASPEPEPEPRHRVARRAAKEARRAGDFDGCVTWLEVAMRDRRRAGISGRKMATLLYERGAARQQLAERLLADGGQGQRTRADALKRESLEDMMLAIEHDPMLHKAYRRRVAVALEMGCNLPEMLEMCSDIQSAMGLDTVAGARWQVSQLAEERREEDEDGADGLRRSLAEAMRPLEAAALDALRERHLVYGKVSVLGAVATAVAEQGRQLWTGKESSAPRHPARRREVASLWVLLRWAEGEEERAACANALCTRLVAHTAAMVGQVLGPEWCSRPRGTDSKDDGDRGEPQVVAREHASVEASATSLGEKAAEVEALLQDSSDDEVLLDEISQSVERLRQQEAGAEPEPELEPEPQLAPEPEPETEPEPAMVAADRSKAVQRCTALLELITGLRALGLHPLRCTSNHRQQPRLDHQRHHVHGHIVRKGEAAHQAEGVASAAMLRAALGSSERRRGGAWAQEEVVTEEVQRSAARILANANSEIASAYRADADEGPYLVPTEVTLKLEDSWDPLFAALRDWLRALDETGVADWMCVN